MLLTTYKFRQARFRGVIAGLLVALAVALYAGRFAPLDTLEARSFDWRQVLAGQRPVPGNVVIAAVDEASIGRLGRWPWPRATMARLVERLSDLGARVVVLDIFFPERENVELLRRLDQWAAIEHPANAAWLELRAQLDGDAQLAAAMRRHGAVVLSLAFIPRSEEAATGADSDAMPAALNRYLIQTVRSTTGSVPAMQQQRFGGVLTNIPELDSAAAAAGHIVMAPDADGVVRREALVLQQGAAFVPAADLTAAALYLGEPTPALNVAAYGITGVSVGARLLPTDEQGRVLLHYYGPERSFTTVSAADILGGAVPRTTVDGKLVVVGVTAQGVGDLRVTPWGPGFPGVEMRATAIQNLISGDGIARPGWMALVDVAVLLLLAWLAFLILRQAALRRALLGVLALVVAYLVAGFIAFRSAGWWLNLVYPTALMLALALAELMQRYVKVDQQQRMVRHAFRHYLAPKLVDLVCDNAAALRLGGERRELSFIFTDLAGFTSLCEKLPAEGLVQLLRTYFERLIEVIHAHHGLVERIVGDGMVVFFNAPLDQPDHACRALRCALGMDAAAEALRSELIAAGIEMGVTRIGINTGDVSTGNFGSSTRFHYTAMGDPINVAARMETANRYLGTRICAARATLERCAEVAWRPIGRLRVKGRGAVVEAGEPVTAEVAATQQFREYCVAYSALEAGTATALEQFAALAAEHPGDPLAQLHQRRLAAGETGVGVEISAS